MKSPASSFRRLLDSSPLLSLVRKGYDGLERLGQRVEKRLPTLPEPSRIPKALPLLGFFLAFALLLTRGINLLANPDFYIEDGREFFQNAHNLGFASLTRAYAGYYHLFPRLAALLADTFPIRQAPLVVALEALLLQAGVAAFLLSSRLAHHFPSIWIRAFLALLIVAYPNGDELYGNIAHSQWYLALLVATILCAKAPASRVQNGLEIFIVGIASVTGPFSLILAPLGIFAAIWDRRFLPHAAVLAIGASLTLASILAHPRAMDHGSRRLPLLFRMIGNQVTVGAPGGYQATRQLAYDPFFNLQDTLLTAAAVAILLFGVRHGNRLVRSIALLGGFSWITVLMSEASWRIIGSPGTGERYFFYLGFAFLASLPLVASLARTARFRWLARGFLAASVVGIAANWLLPRPHTRFDYARQIARYDSLSKGQHLTVKTSIDRRSKAEWSMDLEKR